MLLYGCYSDNWNVHYCRILYENQWLLAQLLCKQLFLVRHLLASGQLAWFLQLRWRFSFARDDETTLMKDDWWLCYLITLDMLGMQLLLSLMVLVLKILCNLSFLGKYFLINLIYILPVFVVAFCKIPYIKSLYIKFHKD